MSESARLQLPLYRRFPGAQQNQVLTSLCQLMGLKDVTSFGATRYGSNGPLNLG